MKGSVVKKGGSWFCVYRVNGKQKWVKGGVNKKQTEKKLIKIINEINDGSYKELTEANFTDFSRYWLKTYAQGKLKASTLKSYVDIIEKHLIPYFCSSKLLNISASNIQEYVSLKLSDGLAPKTVNNHLVPLKEMFKHAVIWGYLRDNPSQYVEKPRVEKEEMDFLTPEEIRLFLGEVNGEHYALFMTAVFTGLRRGELLALQWGDIEFRTGNIAVRRSLYKGNFTSPKSKSSVRKVVMSPALAGVLKKHKFQAMPNKHDLLFVNGVGNTIDADTLVRRQFLPALRRAGIRKIRFHDLRHSYATLLVSQGENIKFVLSQMGHSSIQTKLDRYGHLLPEKNAGGGVRLDETIGIGSTVAQEISNHGFENLEFC